MRRAQRDQLVQRPGREKHLAPGAVVRRGLGNRGGRDSAGRGRRVARGIDDRPVAGAAAEIAGQRVVDGLVLGLLAALLERIQRHHDPRRAEPALARIRLDHRFLERVEPAILRQPLDCDQRLAGELRHRHQAAIDRLVAHARAVRDAEHHRAGAAIALGAALLGAGESPFGPQPVEHGRRRRHAADLAGLSVEQNSDRSAGHASPPFVEQAADYRSGGEWAEGMRRGGASCGDTRCPDDAVPEPSEAGSRGPWPPVPRPRAAPSAGPPPVISTGAPEAWSGEIFQRRRCTLPRRYLRFTAPRGGSDR